MPKITKQDAAKDKILAVEVHLVVQGKDISSRLGGVVPRQSHNCGPV